MSDCLNGPTGLSAMVVACYSAFALLPPALCLWLEYLHLTGRCHCVVVRRRRTDDLAP